MSLQNAARAKIRPDLHEFVHGRQMARTSRYGKPTETGLHSSFRHPIPRPSKLPPLVGNKMPTPDKTSGKQQIAWLVPHTTQASTKATRLFCQDGATFPKSV